MKRKFILIPVLLATLIFSGCEKKEDRAPISPQPAPVPDFTYEITDHVTRTVKFTNASVYAQSYSWNFGDAATSTLASPQHSYPSYSTYSVTLTATGQGGTNTSTKSVTITP